MEELVSTYKIQFGSLGRKYSEIAFDVQRWRELMTLVKTVTVQTEKGGVRIDFDWGMLWEIMELKNEIDKILRELVKYANVPEIVSMMEHCFEVIDQNHKNLCNFVITCSVISDCTEKEKLGCIINVLHQIFLAMNLASPGSCDLWGTKITLETSPSDEEKSVNTVLNLASDFFETAVLMSQELNWPLIEVLPISKAWNWIQDSNIGVNSLAKTNIEKVLCALLQSCTEHQVDTIRLLWLTLSIEALYETPKEGILKALRNRIFLVLETPNLNLKKIKKMIDTFYDVRSEFVHGSLEIPNPATQKMYKIEDNNYIMKLFSSAEFAILILTATLQKLILNDWHRIKFTESYVGEKQMN